MAKEINAETWAKDVLKAEKPVVVDFWHEQCIWCKRLNPVYEELSKEYGSATLAKLDIRASDGNLKLAIKYGVSGTPTMKVFCKGREVGELVGYMEREDLRKELDNILSKGEKQCKQSTELKG